MSRLLAALVMIANLAGAIPVVAAEDLRNRIVIVVDASGSFAGRAAGAVEQIMGLLNDMAARRDRHSRRKSVDEVYVLSLDASPDVIMQGTLPDLRGMDRRAWIDRFEARTGFSACTDITAAFDTALAILAREPAVVGKYLYVFSDLVHDPVARADATKSRKGSKTSSVVCAGPERNPPKDFPWGALRELEAQVALLWLPADQVMRWKPVTREQGLEQQVRFFTDAEAAVTGIEPPAKAKRASSEADRQKDREAISEGAFGVLEVAGIGVLGLAVVGLLGAIWNRLFRGGRSDEARRRSPVPPRPGAPTAAMTAPIQPRRVQGAVPPLNLNNQRRS